MNDILAELSVITTWEAIALIFSLAYVIFAAKGFIWCWPVAFIASAIYCSIFYSAHLLMDSLLQVYYMAMAIYGWFSWKLSWNKKDQHVNYTSWPLNHHLITILIFTLLSLGLGYFMENYTNADFAMLDTFTTVFSIYATYLLAERVVQSWLYWVVIDATSIYIYLNKSLFVTAFLFVCYTVLAIWAYYQWRKHYYTEQSKTDTELLLESE
ncbi:nicotinamide riboside transporter PnuC [Catenovulum sp. 2E275]|uniref:nicotinamide riboside transporter PnuC n=1 Tax=Catenovulum sp. 2E275 TaxID=2980497 RepID=UPI0021D23A10|nr:nicotinamide riboside transporter PnuC [Catenovulum sp. 2E275]MCU4675009.1 nicotinamide riboside transporter PnuC [Catenovulum sp. 2E275]